MNLEKAIEELEELLKHYSPSDEGEILDAIKLGIEALEKVKSFRPDGVKPHAQLLPSETED